MPGKLVQKVVHPNLRDLINTIKREVKIEINCHAVARVESFDPIAKTVEASISYTKTYYKKDKDGDLVPYPESYPILLDCPVIIMGGGGGTLTFPIKKGDDCLILFNDRDLENWVAGSNNSQPEIPSLHAISDAIALVGLRPNITSYDIERARLQMGKSYVAVGKDDKVQIANDLQTIKDLLTELSGALGTLNAALVTPTGIDAGTKAAVTAAISVFDSNVGDLFE